MHRRPLGALALTFALAAAGTAAAPAQGAITLDPTFGTSGFAFDSYADADVIAEPYSIAGPNGTIITAGLTYVFSDFRGGGKGADEPGVTVTRRDRDGKLLSQALFPELQDTMSNFGRVFDMRVLADGHIVVAGSGAFEDGRAYPTGWWALLDAQGNAIKGESLRADEQCPQHGQAVDAGILPSGEVVFAWRCDDEAPDVLTIENPFATPEDQQRGGPQTPVGHLGWDVDLLDVDPEGRIVYYVDDDGRRVGRLLRGPKGFYPDPAFGESGTVEPPTGASFLETDGASRPVLGDNYDLRRRIDGEVVEFSRLEDDGDPDPTFGTGGVAVWDRDDAYGLQSMGVDASGRVMFIQRLVDSRKGRAVVRLTPGGAADEAFGPGGMQILDGERYIWYTGAPFEAGGAVYATLGFQPWDSDSARAAVPAPADIPVVALLRYAEEPTPQPQQQQQNQQQPPAAGPAPAPVSTTVQSQSRSARTCLSRRRFTIRVRPQDSKRRKITSATVTVAGKKVRTTKKDGRWTATVDLRKLKQATFDVKVTARSNRGRTYRETRSYRTCRVGENGPKVKGGSIVINLGA